MRGDRAQKPRKRLPEGARGGAAQPLPVTAVNSGAGRPDAGWAYAGLDAWLGPGAELLGAPLCVLRKLNRLPDVAVKEVESYDEFVGAMTVLMDAFEIPEAMRAEAVPDFPKRWEEYRQSGNPQRQYLATIGGDAVGQATAWCGDAGINLFGGAVLEHARGRGVYRALTLARWEEAVRCGTPALTVQAGRMSMPILTKLGFVPVGQIRVYVDDLTTDEAPS